MSKTGKKTSKKKVAKIVIISLVVFVVINLLGAAIGTSTAITHPSGSTYEAQIASVKEHGGWGDYDSYDKFDYIVNGLDGYELNCTKVSTPETEGTGKYVIITHGFGNNKYGCVKFCGPFIDLGFTCITYDVRAHGNNGKSLCTMGQLESPDLNYIIEDTYSRYGDVDILGLQGESMGSLITLNTLKLTDKVDFCVADCGFCSLQYMVHDMYDHMYLYPFGTCADIGFKVLYGVDTAEVSGIDALKGKGVPILFIHGTADKKIYPHNSELMYEEASKYAYCELWMVEGAAHGCAREVAGEEEYSRHIGSFLESAGVVSSEDAGSEVGEGEVGAEAA